MLVAAVAGVDDGDAGVVRGAQGRALLRVAHGADVRIAGDNADGVRHAFPFGGGAGICRGKAENAAAHVEHGGLKAQAGAGAGFIKQGGELFARAGLRVSLGLCFNPAGQIQQGADFLHGKVKRVNHMNHNLYHAFLFGECRSNIDLVVWLHLL